MGRIENFVPKKSWLNPQDFPVVTNSEDQARKNMQELHDETTAYINGTLVQNANAHDAAIAAQKSGAFTPTVIDLEKMGFGAWLADNELTRITELVEGYPFEDKIVQASDSAQVAYFDEIYNKVKAGSVFRLAFKTKSNGSGNINDHGVTYQFTHYTEQMISVPTVGADETRYRQEYENRPGTKVDKWVDRVIRFSSISANTNFSIKHSVWIKDGVTQESYLLAKNAGIEALTEA